MVNYNFQNHVKGDTFNGVLFTVTVNDVAFDLTGATITMDVRPTKTGSVVATYSTTTTGITISSPSTAGKFTFDEQIIDIAAAKYVYDIEIELSSGTVKTYIWGNWEITQDVTYD